MERPKNHDCTVQKMINRHFKVFENNRNRRKRRGEGEGAGMMAEKEKTHLNKLRRE